MIQLICEVVGEAEEAHSLRGPVVGEDGGRQGGSPVVGDGGGDGRRRRQKRRGPEADKGGARR